MNLQDLVSNFNTTPFLFIGSGITRRYLGLPNWKDLLVHFAKEISDDEFIYDSYINKANQLSNPVGLMPRIATLIERDYNTKWYTDTKIRTLDKKELEAIKKGNSPFKAEVASYIKHRGHTNNNYKSEIEQLTQLARKNISGVITTNYDTFIEDHFLGYKTYIGQSELIFSAIQGIAEIYKIHGSIIQPESMVLDEKDYETFDKRKAYLAAKLMTIFVEYPIIFMGYSLSDSNIRNIISSIINCLNQQQLNTLENRFIFVDYQKDKRGVDIVPSNFLIDNLSLPMTKVTLSDYSLLYRALAMRRVKLPVKLLRRFKQDLYKYVITSSPTSTLRVAPIDDNHVKDSDWALAIGKATDFSLHGLSGITGDEWYRNIVLDDLNFSADELLKYAFPTLLSQNSGKLPVNKLLFQAKDTYPQAEEVSRKYDFDHLISRTIKKNRRKYSQYNNVNDIWKNEHNDLVKATESLSYLTEDQIDIDDLSRVLKDIFLRDRNILQHSRLSATNQDRYLRTNIRRLINI